MAEYLIDNTIFSTLKAARHYKRYHAPHMPIILIWRKAHA